MSASTFKGGVCAYVISFKISCAGPKVSPNKRVSVFRVTGLKILGKVGTHTFFILSFFWKKYNFMHFERHFAFKNA